MKLFTHLVGVIALAALTVGVSTASAKFGPSEPRVGTPAVEQPDAVARYLDDRAAVADVERTGAAGHPDSLALRPGVAFEPVAVSSGSDWTAWAVGALGGALLAILAVVGASAVRERRRLVLR